MRSVPTRSEAMENGNVPIFHRGPCHSGSMTSIARTLFLTLAWAALALAAVGRADTGAQPLSAFARTTLRIETPSGRAHSFDVYVARSEREHMQGLMFVESLPENAGMLFPFDPPRPAAM